MPRINKIRLTGVKYDNFRKGYENTLFDFTRNDEPDHTLFTLVNQGGKGVFMQLVSQITMPDTRWGKESGNRIISMFYDMHKNFRPYTFHVIIEWKLDVVPEKWLITGICVSAEKRYSQSEEQDERTGLNYFHYTIEHDNNGFYAIEKLPVYDSMNNRAVEYEQFEKFIDENGKYIVKYHMSQTRRHNSPYYEYLKRWGIQRTEWEIMKIINRSEGGVSNYFSSATDNKSVIDKMIIPAITQYMNNYNEYAGESLKNMFISNLSITRDLPRLLERENDYRELIVLLEPLAESAEEGCETDKKFQRHISEGNNIVAVLENISDMVSDKKKSLEEQLKKTEEELSFHNFENENLEYARYCKQQKEKKVLIENSDSEIIEYESKLVKRNILKHEIQADLLLKKREFTANKRKTLVEKKQYLIKSMGIKDLSEEIDRLESDIKGKWDKNKAFFEDIACKHHSYRKYNEQSNAEINDKKERETKRLREIREEIAVFNDRKQRHIRDYKKLAEYFDYLSLAFPEQLLNEMKEKSKERIDRIKALEISIKKSEEELTDVQIKIYKNDSDRNSELRDLKRKQDNYEQMREKEEKLRNEICKAEGIDPISAVYTHTWAQNNLSRLNTLIDENKQKIERLKTGVWELNTDLELNKGDYWVPNNDIRVLKQHMEKLGITPVLTGVEFLHGLDKKTANEMLMDNPLLTYGIVIPSYREWEIIDKNIDKSILLRSAVPIFIRKGMRKAEIMSVLNSGHRIAVDSEEYMNWRSKIDKKAGELKESVKILEKRIDWLSQIVMDINGIIRQKESNEILKDMNNIKTVISEHDKLISDLKTKTEKINERLNEEKISLDKTKKEEEIEKGKIHWLESYTEEDNSIRKLEEHMKLRVQAENETARAIDEMEQQKKKIMDYIMDDEVNFRRWKDRLNEKINRLRAVIPEAFVDFRKESEAKEKSMPEYNINGQDGIFEDIDKRQELAGRIEERNAEIAVIEEKIKRYGEIILEYEKSLDETLKEWRIRKIPLESEQELALRLSDTEKDITETEKKLNEKKLFLNRLEGELEQLDNSIATVRRRLSERYGRQAEHWEDMDIDRKEYEIRRNIESCKKSVKALKVHIGVTENKLNEIILSLSGLKKYEELDANDGNVDDLLLSKLEKDTRNITELWQNGYKDIKRRLTDIEMNMRNLLENFRNQIRMKIGEKILKEKLLIEIQNINAANFSGNLESFKSMREHFRKELQTASSDKKKAEEIREQWAQRASKHIIRIIELMREMVHGMVYINTNDHAFPLIRLKGEEMMPGKEEEILGLLKEYFIISINKIIENQIQPEDIDSKMLDDLMGDRVLFSQAVRGRYPVMMVYKMTERNEFKYAKAHDYFYASWEAVNRGEESSAEGSGGQRLAISTFMMMMLVNFKKRTVGSKNPWTVLLMDNPFGQASAKHILDPVFEIANSLNFQIIAFASPEIIKIEISKRFPVFWELRIEESGEKGMGLITSRLIHGGRIIKN